jgi:hypothetical protein
MKQCASGVSRRKNWNHDPESWRKWSSTISTKLRADTGFIIQIALGGFGNPPYEEAGKLLPH